MYFAVIAAIAFLTGQAFFTAQLMPDAFSAPMVLAIYLLGFKSQAITRTERVLLVLLVAFSCLVHMSHLAVCAGLVLVLSGIRLFYRRLNLVVPWHGLVAALIILPDGQFYGLGHHGLYAMAAASFCWAVLCRMVWFSRYWTKYVLIHVSNFAPLRMFYQERPMILSGVGMMPPCARSAALKGPTTRPKR